ncbi:MAG: polymer-forming cytoskeletal protein [Desulforhabdus sp.]|jgi:cytoskeletal protein CcmA (bactofilin family)|nr:polymer-forming cytoskeletal protein [Desulforhabdus sp.]
MKLFKSVSQKGEGSSIKSVDTVIGPHTIFSGSLQAENSVCVEGEFRGQLASKGGVLINRDGLIEADIIAEYVVVHGRVVGNISAQRQLEISETGKVHGDVQAPSVVIVKGGMLDGFCRMENPSELQPEPDRSASVEHEAAMPDDIIVPMEESALGVDERDERIHIIRSFDETEKRL